MTRYITWYQDSRAVSLCSGLPMGSINLVYIGITSQEDFINESQNLKDEDEDDDDQEEQEETPVNSLEWLACLMPVDPTEARSGPQGGIPFVVLPTTPSPRDDPINPLRTPHPLRLLSLFLVLLQVPLSRKMLP